VIYEGLKFMAIGMGVVFSFLILMVVVMQANAAVITKYFPEKEEPVEKSTGGIERSKVAAAIAIALANKK
jgi:oxaloacetate decarboxylase gamma subunit